MLSPNAAVESDMDEIAYTKRRRKLIEVALPLEAINAACKAEKNRSMGTIRNIHKWFAPMPAPAWRALLAASLLDDPGPGPERDQLLAVVEQLVSTNVSVLNRAVKEVRSRIDKQYGGTPPTVADPFCGGGSTVVEAQRLGLPSFASDLNPIAVLITKALAEIPQAVVGSPQLTSDRGSLDVRGHPLEGFERDTLAYAERIYAKAKESIGRHYPSASNGDTVIAYRWARTVVSPDPSVAGARTPLVTDWWLSKKPGEIAWAEPLVDRTRLSIEFAVRNDGTPPPPSGGTGARCLFTGTPISFEYLRREGSAGRLGVALFSVVTQGSRGRTYLPPDPEQEAAASVPVPEDKPELELPNGGLGFRVQPYGITQWWQLFTPRQNRALGTFADLVAQIPEWVREDGGSAAYGKAIATVLGLALGKLVRSNSTLALWRTRLGPSKAESAFNRNDLPMTWDFTEVNPFGHSVGDWMQVVETAVRAFDYVDPSGAAVSVRQLDARNLSTAFKGPALIATDPPYFHYIGYSDLSNYFYVWIRRALRNIYPDLFATLRAPYSGELIADPSRHEGSQEAASRFFTDGFKQTFGGLMQVSDPSLPILIVYAFKQQESSDRGATSTGWEAMLQAILESGLSIVGTWPIHGTGSTRQRSQGSNTLATYVLLVCHQRPAQASVATRRDFQITLKHELATAVSELTDASIAPVDLAQALIGPGMAIFSRYSKVIEADGSAMSVRTALSMINQTLDAVLSEQEHEFDAATRWALTWFEQNGFSEGPFGDAETLSKAKDIPVMAMESDGFLSAQGGRVRLLRPNELEVRTSGSPEARTSIWLRTLRLVQALLASGESAAGELLSEFGSRSADATRDLAYRLFISCERRGWSEDAGQFNALAVAWNELTRLADASKSRVVQTTLGADA